MEPKLFPIKNNFSKELVNLHKSTKIKIGGLTMSNVKSEMANEILNCKLCNTIAHVPAPVEGHNHKHYQIICKECGIEVININREKCYKIWNKLMAN